MLLTSQLFTFFCLIKIMERHVFQNINIINEAGEHSLKLGAVFQEGSMNLTVFENDTAWNTLITRPELKISADNHKTEFSVYLKNLQKYIENCPENVEIKFQDGTLSVNVLLKNNMKAVYFTTNLRKVNFSTTIFALIEKLYKEKIEHDSILEERQRQFDNLEKTKNSYEVKLNEFVQRKQEEDLDLNSKFLVILNEKKQHIQHLNDLLNAFRRGRPTVNEPKITKRRKIQKKQSSLKNKKPDVVENKEEVDGSNPSTEEEISYSTDEESNLTSKRITWPAPTRSEKQFTKRELSPIPSTSKDAFINYSSEENSDEMFLNTTKKIKSKEFIRDFPGQSDGKDITSSSQKGVLDTQELLNMIP